MSPAEAMPTTDDFHQRIRALEALGGLAVHHIKVFQDDELVVAGDGAFKFAIAEDLDGGRLLKVEAFVTTESSSGTVNISIQNGDGGPDMLSTPLTIDAGEKNSKDAATEHVVDPDNDDIAWGDEIWINIDNAGVDAQGLGVYFYFIVMGNSGLSVRGLPGPPGGITDFTGDWTLTTIYNAGDIVVHNGIIYVSTSDHTASGTNEPGVGVDWEDFWAQVADLPMQSGVTFEASAPYPLLDGTKGLARMPFDATIIEAAVFGDVAGAAVVDIWVTDFAGYPPSAGDSITGGNPLVLSGSVKNQDLTLTGWTTALSEGDIIVPYVSGVTLITRLAVYLKFQKG